MRAPLLPGAARLLSKANMADARIQTLRTVRKRIPYVQGKLTQAADGDRIARICALEHLSMLIEGLNEAWDSVFDELSRRERMGYPEFMKDIEN